ncbi:MAG: hypothetical protein ACRCSK_08255 [Fusobacteriaceae bacterium]
MKASKKDILNIFVEKINLIKKNLSKINFEKINPQKIKLSKKTKKYLRIFLWTLFLVLGYFNYFGKESLKQGGDRIIQTDGVSYYSKDYQIEAESQYDNLDKNETTFSKARALINNMILSGDNVFMDKAKNIFLNSNIFGVLPNGWKITANNLKYSQATDQISSETGVNIKNDELKINISADKISSNSKFDIIELKDNIILANEDIQISGNVAVYNNFQKNIFMPGKVLLDTKENSEKNKQKLSGTFDTINYNVETKNLSSSNKFFLKLGQSILYGNNILYNAEKETLKISDKVVIHAKDYKINFGSIEKKSNKNIVNLNGKIFGSNGLNDFYADDGIYNIETKELSLIGNVKKKQKNGDDVELEKIFYNTDTDYVTVYRKDGMVFRGKNEKQQNVFTDVTIENKAIGLFMKGDKLISEEGGITKVIGNVKVIDGDYFTNVNQIIYNSKESRVDIPENVNVKTKSNQIQFFSERPYADTKNKIVYNKKINGNGKNYDFSGENSEYNYETGLMILKNNGIIKTSSSIFSGNNIGFNQKTNEMFASEAYTIISKDMKITGDKINMNQTSGEINGGKVFITSGKNGKLQADNVGGNSNKNYIDLKNNVKGVFSSDKGETTNYNGSLARIFLADSKTGYQAKKIALIGDSVIDVKNQATIYSKSSEIFPDTEEMRILSRSKVILIDKNMGKSVALADTFIMKGENIELIGNVVIDNEKALITADKAIYSTETKILKAMGKVVINNKEQK